MTVKYELVVCMHSVCGKCMNLGWWISRLEHHFIQTGWIQMLKWIIWPHTRNFYVNLGTIHSLTFCANKSFSLRKIVRFCYLIWPRDQKHVCQPVNFTVNWIEMLSNIVYSYSQPTSLCVFCCCCCCLRSAHCMKHCISKKLLTVGIAPPKRMHHSWAAVAVAA